MQYNDLFDRSPLVATVCFPLPATSYLPGFRPLWPRADGTVMTSTPEPGNPLARALKQLATATKVISFYPSQHPTVVTTMERAVALLKEALTDRESLTVTVGEDAFLADGAPVAEGDRGLAAFATYLNRRDLSAVVFTPPIEADPLRGLLEVIALDPGTLRSRGGPKRA